MLAARRLVVSIPRPRNYATAIARNVAQHHPVLAPALAAGLLTSLVGLSQSSRHGNVDPVPLALSTAASPTLLIKPYTSSLATRLLALSRRFYQQVRALLRLTEMLAVTGPCLLTYPLVARLQHTYPALYDQWWNMFINAVTFLGPASIKFFQWASSRRDLFDADFCDRLAVVQNRVKPHSWAQTDKALKKALGAHYREFLEVEEEVLGSGCIAQVYKARLLFKEGEGGVEEKGQGWTGAFSPFLASSPPASSASSPSYREVAVKVVHPHVKSTIDTDLNLFLTIAAGLESFPSFKYWSLADALTEFTTLMYDQMDMRKEAHNLHRLRDNFKSNPSVTFPEPVNAYVSEDVLVEEYVHGESISNYIAMDDAMAPPGLRQKLAALSLSSFLQMLITHNFAHADLHPGNVLVRDQQLHQQYQQQGQQPVLAFLDAGICTELSRPSRHAFVRIMYHAALGDGEKVAQAVLDTAPEHDCNDPEGFVRAITAIVEDMQEKELNNEEKEVVRMTRRRLSKEERAVADAKEGADLQKKAADAVGRIFETCRQYRVKLDGSLSTVVIATFILEGLGRSLDPQLNIFHAALPLLMASPFAR